LFVGIDFSKETFDAAILKVSDGSSFDLKIIGNEQFKNDVPGCKRFVKWLNKTCALSGDYSSVLVGGEDTGNYSTTLPKQLYVLGIDCSLQNAYSIKCGSGKIVRDKTDKMDAEKIAYYFYRFRDQIRLYKPLSKDMESLERLYSYRYGQVRERARLKCQIKEYRHLLKSEPNDETLKFMIQRLEKQERFLKKEIKAIEAKMIEIIKANEELNEIHECLVSIPGIGKITSL
ncbi:transposase, partial [Porphyromonas sp. HMSC077F02]|uniref:IS110 family transposase n=1 Tax=Porphyromonas sp. HMSC077F02 TaxID=1739529 RepID=UPI001438CCD2